MNIDLTPLHYLKQARSQAQKENRADLVDCFNQFEDLYEKKLWHQLSLQVDHFLSLPNIDHYLVPFYQHFVRDFQTKLNKLNLVAGIGAAVTRQLPDDNARIEFLTTLANLVEPSTQPSKKSKDLNANEKEDQDLESLSAGLLAKTYAAQCQLHLKQLDQVATHIAQSEQVLDKIEGMDVRVTSAFYKVAADYYQVTLAYAKFYKTSLLFLGTLGVPLNLDPKEALERARDLSMAALVSEDIYQFGELLMHPILDALKSSPLEWLGHLLVAFNTGDLAAFEKLSSHFHKEPLLQQHHSFLSQKMCLMALVDFVFRGHLNTSLPFTTLASFLNVSIPVLEHIVMKACSLKLVKATMDQVNQTVMFTWVVPRVLDRSKLIEMVSMLDHWKSKVQSTLTLVEQNAKELVHEVA